MFRIFSMFMRANLELSLNLSASDNCYTSKTASVWVLLRFDGIYDYSIVSCYVDKRRNTYFEVRIPLSTDSDNICVRLQIYFKLKKRCCMNYANLRKENLFQVISIFFRALSIFQRCPKGAQKRNKSNFT